MIRFLHIILSALRVVLSVLQASFEKLATPFTSEVSILKTKIKRATENTVEKIHQVFLMPTILSLNH